jgi:hypothetical protein
VVILVLDVVLFRTIRIRIKIKIKIRLRKKGGKGAINFTVAGFWVHFCDLGKGQKIMERIWQHMVSITALRAEDK